MDVLFSSPWKSVLWAGIALLASSVPLLSPAPPPTFPHFLSSLVCLTFLNARILVNCPLQSVEIYL